MNRNHTLKIVLAVALPLMAACAHHRDVRAGEDGINRVVLKSENKDGLYRDGMDQAEDFCKQSHRSPVVVSENTKYTGDMDEDNYNTGKKISKAAEIAGGAVFVMGGKTESNTGRNVGVGGGVADSILGSGYTYELKFRCK